MEYRNIKELKKLPNNQRRIKDDSFKKLVQSLYLLGESHFAIHTFPEQNSTYIELVSCVKDKFDNFLKNII